MSNNFCTPRKPSQLNLNKIKIPPSPFMKKIGYGTGVAVYELQRSPAFNKIRSPWAIKKVIKRARDATAIKSRLKTEAEILRKLIHPNVVGFRAYVENQDGNNLLAMEECTSSLGDLIETRSDNDEGPFRASDIIKVAADVAGALNYLHNTALILHCDLKSYNVLVKGDFKICKLCDFGVCLPITAEGGLDKKEAPGGEYTGTRSWMAPEVLGCTQDISTKADIYSYGLTLWEMIALSPPILEDIAGDLDSCAELDADMLDELLERVNTRERPAIPENVDLGPEYANVLEIYYCCTDFNKDKRPSASDLVKIMLEDVAR